MLFYLYSHRERKNAKALLMHCFEFQERKARQLEEMRREAEAEAANSVNMRQIEDDAIKKILESLNLMVKDVRIT